MAPSRIRADDEAHTGIESNASTLAPEQKYAIEAAKRTRADGSKQFEQLHFSSNERLRQRIKFLILGAEMGGILMAVKLIKEGFDTRQMLLVDTAGGVGGTWYWNRYPGLHCDVEAYVYLPLLEETRYIPKEKYSSSVEIRAHLERIVKHYGFEDRILFRTHATGLQWDENGKTWNADLTMYRGSKGKEAGRISVLADFAILASGLFPYPQVPKVNGLADFRGSMLHTARWDYDITGGRSDTAFPKLDKLSGKRVTIIGTGATSIQVVPQVAQYAAQLFVFQRTPSQVNPRGQRATDPDEWREKIAAKPGWQMRRLENFAEHVSGHLPPGVDDLVDDGWTHQPAYCALVGSKNFGHIDPQKAKEHIDALLRLDADHSKQVRDRVTKIVRDETTAKNLTPCYPGWCKRPTYSDVYLPTFNQPNVKLVDTDGKGIESVTPYKVVANGTEYPVDVLILSTGYRAPGAGGDPGSRMGIEIVGRGGRKMADKWDKQGVSTLHGVFTNGFPNLFFQSPIQTSATANYHHVLQVATDHISSIIATAHERRTAEGDKVVVEPSAEAEEAWGMTIAQGGAFFSAIAVCTPSYLTEEGGALRMERQDPQAMLKKAKTGIWYKGIVDFSRMMEDWRRDGRMEGVEVTIDV